MSLIDTPFELLAPKDYDQVITELQAAKRDLVEALGDAADNISLACTFMRNSDKIKVMKAVDNQYRSIINKYEVKS